MHSITVSKSLLAVAAVLQLSSAAPLPLAVDSVIEKAAKQGIDLSSPLSANWIEKAVDDIDGVSARSLKSPKIGTTSSGTSEGSSESSDDKTKTSGLLGAAEPLAASWIGGKIGDEIGSIIGLTSSDTTSSAAYAATDSIMSSVKERRKLKSSGSASESTSGSSSESSGLGTALDLGKDLVTGTLMNGATQIGGDYLASNIEGAVDPSTSDAASAKERRKLRSSGSTSEGSSGSSSGSTSDSSSGSSGLGTVLDLGKDLVTGTLMNGATQIGGDYLASSIEGALDPSTSGAASAKERRKLRSSGSTSESSSTSNVESSVGEDAWNLGKQFLKDSFTSGATQIGGDYIANSIEGAMAPASTTEAAAARKRDFEHKEFPLNETADHIRIGTIDLTPYEGLGLEESSGAPTPVRAEKRKSAIGSIAKAFGGDILEQGASSLASDWIVDKAESELGMDSSTATPTAAASRKRANMAGQLALKTGKKAAGKAFHDETKNKTESVKDDVKHSFEDIKNKLKDFLFSDDGDDDDGSDSKMLRRSVAGALLDIAEEAVQKRSSVPIGEPVESPSELEQRAPQGLFSATKNIWKMLDNMPTDTSDSTDDDATDNGNDDGNGGTRTVANIGLDVAKRGLEVSS